MRRVNRGFVVSAAVALLLAGCGDDANDDSTVTQEADDSTITQESAESVLDDAAADDGVAPLEATWTRVDIDIDGEVNDVAITDSGFVAVGEDEGGAAVWTSTDGVTWRRATQVPDTRPPEGPLAAVSEDGTVAVKSRGPFGIGETAVWVSPAGRVWNRVVGGPAFFGDLTNLVDVTRGGPGWVAVGTEDIDREAGPPRPDGKGSSAVVWTSPDRLSWTRVPHDDAIFGGVMVGVTAGDQGLLAFGHTGGPQPVVWTSPDGSSWTRARLDEALFDDAFPTPSRHAVVAGGPGWVAVGGTTTGGPFDWDGGPAAWTSPDGATWTRLPDNAFVGGPGEQLVAVTATPSRLVAFGDGSSLWTSTDGTTWTNTSYERAAELEARRLIAAAHADATDMIVVGDALWIVTLPN